MELWWHLDLKIFRVLRVTIAHFSCENDILVSWELPYLFGNILLFKIRNSFFFPFFWTKSSFFSLFFGQNIPFFLLLSRRISGTRPSNHFPAVRLSVRPQTSTFCYMFVICDPVQFLLHMMVNHIFVHMTISKYCTHDLN